MNDIDDFSDTNIISNNNYDNYAFGSDYLNSVIDNNNLHNSNFIYDKNYINYTNDEVYNNNKSYINNDSHDTDNKYL